MKLKEISKECTDFIELKKSEVETLMKDETISFFEKFEFIMDDGSDCLKEHKSWILRAEDYKFSRKIIDGLCYERHETIDAERFFDEFFYYIEELEKKNLDPFETTKKEYESIFPGEYEMSFSDFKVYLQAAKEWIDTNLGSFYYG